MNSDIHVLFDNSIRSNPVHIDKMVYSNWYTKNKNHVYHIEVDIEFVAWALSIEEQGDRRVETRKGSDKTS